MDRRDHGEVGDEAVVKGAGEERGRKQTARTPRTLSASTVTKIYRLFSARMKAAVVADRIDATPRIGIELPARTPSDEYFLTRDGEYARLLSAGPDELAEIVLELGVGTGMRWGEWVGLHRNRVDIQHRRILVHEVYAQDEGVIMPYPKGRAKRGVPITDELAEKLQRWMDAHPPVACRTTHRVTAGPRSGARCSTTRTSAATGGTGWSRPPDWSTSPRTTRATVTHPG